MIDFKEIETTYNDIGRLYKTPEGDFPSVTTMLGNTGDKTFLDVWRKRIGIDEANKQTRVAGHLGTEYHELGENYLSQTKPPEVQWFAKDLFEKTKPILDKNITKVHAVEIPLYSSLLRLAGRTDAVVDWNNELAIFDFKCIKHLNPEYLGEYWIQTSIYSKMLEEMFGMKPKKLVLVCANKLSRKVAYFESTPNKHSKVAVERIKMFRKILKNT